ncbi:MAG TPA: T9SS type A sorting domain-containing protein [Bacteroidia bacterium]|nr:T9SS type A sorting domain-containing protein [Bacteroidia bacterium]
MNSRIPFLIFLFVLSLFNLPSQVSYTFTTAGATGSTGPTQLQVNSAYVSTNLNGSVTVLGSGIQQFTVPTSGNYRILAAGSSGGGVINAFGCRGRIVQGEVYLNAGQVIKILVGQKGVTGSTSTGGGGGSYVVTSTNSLLAVGGGGGGYCTPILSAVPSSDGSYGNNGQNYSGSSGGGTGGTSGGGGNGAPSGWGGGGSGFSGNGTAAFNCAGTGGFSFLNGGLGGSTCNNSVGGFGGGGGTHGNTGGGGGGGGYSGGGGSGQTPSTSTGGGGGSYLSASLNNQSDQGFNTGQGYVVLTRIAGVVINQLSPVLCNGQLTAVLTASANGGIAPYTYSWSTGATGTIVSGLGAGSYSCTATDASSVSYTSFYVVSEPTSLSTLITQTNVTCNAGTNGAINLSVSGGTSPYTYSWSPSGGSSAYAGSLGAGSYTCLISDMNACQTSAIVNITQPLPVNVVGFATNTLVCNGQLTTLIAAGALTYTWTGGVVNGVPFAPSSSSDFTVTGANAIGCTGTAVVSISVNPIPSLIVSGTSSICSGNSAILNVSGASTYTWSTGSNLSSISVSPLSTTNYSVSGTNSFACSSSTVITVNVVSTNPSVTATAVNPVVCAGFSTQVYGGGANSYTWSGGVNNNVPFTPLSTSLYTVTGSNVCGTGTAAVLVTVNNLPNVTANASSTAVCIGNSVVLSGGGALSYTWTGGVNNGVAFVPGSTQTYTVNGTDANGCRNSAVRTVVVNPLPVVTANVSNSVVCFGSTVIFTGGGAQTYTWTGGVVDGVSYFTISTATYTVTGTDANGCQNNAVTSVTVLTVPVITTTISNPVVCQGFSTSVQAGGAFTYTWSGGLSNGVPFIPLSSTVYTVTGTNPCGTGSNTVAVTVNNLPLVSANASSTVVCIGSPVTLFGGGAVSYTWSGGVINNSPFNPSVSATYTVTGTDANGCKNSASKTVNVNALPNVGSTASNTLMCNGGTVALNGTGALSYSWTGGVINGLAFTPSATTSFTVTGTDANGCQNSAVRSISVNALPVVFANASASVLCFGNSTSLYGTGASTYTWSAGPGNGVLFYPTSSTTYSVNGTNTLTGCTSTNAAVITITVNPLPTLVTSANPAAVCIGQACTFSASGAHTYTWNGGIQNGIPFTPLTSTNYIVSATNTITGCSNMAVQNITVNSLPFVSAGISNAIICAGYSTSVWGSGANTYTWTSGVQNGIPFAPLVSTSYSVSGTNTLTGCTSTNVASVSVQVNALPNLTVSATNTNVCQGVSTIFNASGANTFNWSHGIVNGQAFFPISSAIYTVTGTNLLTGCANSATLFVQVNPSPVLNITASSTSVCAGHTLSLNAFGADTYTWSGGLSNGIPFSPTSSGNYTVTGTFTLTGCVSQPVSQAISVVPLPVVSASASANPLCVGSPVVLYGLGGNTYSWSGGVMNAQAFSPSVSSSYTVSGTSTLSGCSSTNLAVINLSVNALPVLSVSSTSSLLCLGETASLSVNGANTYTWNGSVTGSSLIVSPILISSYTVEGTSSQNCVGSAVITVSVSDCTGLGELQIETAELQVYPNPSTGIFSLRSSSDGQFKLLNSLGQTMEVLELRAGEIQSLNRSDLAKGVYYLVSSAYSGKNPLKLIFTE